MKQTLNWKKNAFLYLSSQSVSLFGSSLVQYAITWYITLSTQSGLMMTLSIICGFLPTFILSPFAGVWADRYNRKALIMLSDLLIALSTLVIAVLFLFGQDALWLLFAVSVVRAFGAAIQKPAVGAFLPQLVPADKLTKVNAAYTSIQALIMLTAPMLSGALLTASSIEYIFLIDVATAAAAIAILLLFLNVPNHEKANAGRQAGYLDDLRAGFAYIRAHSYVRKFFVLLAIYMVLATPVTFLTPLQVSRSFGSDVWRLTAVEVVFSIGMIGGGILMATWGGFKNKTHTMVLSAFMVGACTLVLGIVPNFWVYLLFILLIGIAMPVYNTPSTALLQQKVEDGYLGRVFGALTMITSSMMPIGMLVFGPLADIVRIEWLLVGTGLLMLIQGVAMVRDRELLQAGTTESPSPDKRPNEAQSLTVQ